MRHHSSFRHAAFLLALVPAFAGCSGTAEEGPTIACPLPGIINGLESVERHQGDATAPLVYRAALENLGGVCAVEGGDLRTDLSVDIVVEPGPAYPGGTLELPYFVAVTRASGEVIDRQDLVARIDIPPGKRQAGSTESFSQRFVGLGAGAPDYRVLFGFVMSPEEAMARRQAL